MANMRFTELPQPEKQEHCIQQVFLLKRHTLRRFGHAYFFSQQKNYGFGTVAGGAFDHFAKI